MEASIAFTTPASDKIHTEGADLGIAKRIFGEWIPVTDFVRVKSLRQPRCL